MTDPTDKIDENDKVIAQANILALMKAAAPTPETDELSDHYSDTDPIPACYRSMRQHARTLERQRDQARAEVAERQGMLEAEFDCRMEAEAKLTQARAVAKEAIEIAEGFWIEGGTYPRLAELRRLLEG